MSKTPCPMPKAPCWHLQRQINEGFSSEGAARQGSTQTVYFCSVNSERAALANCSDLSSCRDVCERLCLLRLCCRVSSPPVQGKVSVAAKQCIFLPTFIWAIYCFLVDFVLVWTRWCWANTKTMSSPRDFHLILEKGTDYPGGSSLLPYSPVLLKSSYHFFASILCLWCGVLHGWLVVASAWPWGARQGGRRHQVLCYCSGAGSVLPLHTSSLGQDGSCLCPHHGQLSSAGTLHSTTPWAQGKPLGEHGAPNSISVLLALANAITLCRMHAGTGSSCCSASLSPEFLCMPQVLCVQCLQERRREYPMAWRWGQPQRCVWGWAAMRQEWDGSSWEWQWEGMRMLCGLTATFPAKGDVLARESLHWGRGGMGTPVNCRDELPCSTEQRVFLASTRLCLTVCHHHWVRSQECLQLTQLPGDP